MVLKRCDTASDGDGSIAAASQLGDGEVVVQTQTMCDERARAIEGHLKRSADAERQHTARLVLFTLRKDELLELLARPNVVEHQQPPLPPLRSRPLLRRGFPLRPGRARPR